MNRLGGSVCASGQNSTGGAIFNVETKPSRLSFGWPGVGSRTRLSQGVWENTAGQKREGTEMVAFGMRERGMLATSILVRP